MSNTNHNRNGAKNMTIEQILTEAAAEVIAGKIKTAIDTGSMTREQLKEMIEANSNKLLKMASELIAEGEKHVSTGYQARISHNNGSFFALIVRIDRDGQESVINGYNARHFQSRAAAEKSTANYIRKNELETV
jgi:hypothetical protein